MYPLLVINSEDILAIQFLLILLIALPILAVLSVMRNEFAGNDRYIWISIIILLPIVGPLMYIFIGRSRRLNKY